MLSRVGQFDISMNGFTGTLPENGLQAMRSVFLLYAHANRFAGALPKTGFSDLAGLLVLTVGKNNFEGTIPTSLHAQVVFLGHNLLAGPIAGA
eukprot:2045176-Amphidinium_carterae.1